MGKSEKGVGEGEEEVRESVEWVVFCGMGRRDMGGENEEIDREGEESMRRF